MKTEWLVSIINILLPTLLFYGVYKAAGIIPAVIVAAGYSIISMIYGLMKGKKISNTKIIGLVGLIGSAVVIAYTGQERYYYVPALIENMVFLIFMLVLTVKKKSVLHFLAKDFKIKSLEEIPEDKMMAVNVIWVVFFILKICSKLLGMLYLSFEQLYWLVFLLGDPMTIVAIAASILVIRRSMWYSHLDAENAEGIK